MAIMAIEMLSAESAIERIILAGSSGAKILGVDGFRLVAAGYVAPLDLILDLSNRGLSTSVAEQAAIDFIRKNAADDVRFEVVTDD